MALVVLAVVLAALPAANARTTPPTSPQTGACTTTAVNVLFWPTGHPAVPEIGVPGGAGMPPHSEIYLPTTTYPDADFLAHFDDGGGRSIAESCPVGSVPPKVKNLATKKLETVTTTTVLACTFTNPVVIDIRPVRGTSDFQLRLIVKKTARVTELLGSSPSLAYDKKACAVQPALF